MNWSAVYSSLLSFLCLLLLVSILKDVVTVDHGAKNLSEKLKRKSREAFERLKKRMRKSKTNKLGIVFGLILTTGPLLSACSTHTSVQDPLEAVIPSKPIRPLIKLPTNACISGKDLKELYLYLKAKDAYEQQLLNLIKPVLK